MTLFQGKHMTAEVDNELESEYLFFDPTDYDDEYDSESEIVCEQLNRFYKMLINRSVEQEEETSPNLEDTMTKISILKMLKKRGDQLAHHILSSIWTDSCSSENGLWIDEDRFLETYQDLIGTIPE